MAGLSCGIDIGSTNIKVVLADARGRSRWVKSVATPRRHDGLGPVTDAAALVAQLEDMIIAGWRDAGGGVPLQAIAASGVGEDGIGVDGGLNPTGHALAWFDKRAADETAWLARAYPDHRFYFYTTACKWLWLRKHRAGELETAGCWVALTDYPSAVWSGSAFMSETLAARTGCFDMLTRQWLPRLLAASRAPSMPRVLKAGQVAGTMMPGRLRAAGAASAATVLVAGGHDHAMAASAIRRLAADARVDSIGTANVIYGETIIPPSRNVASDLDISVPALGGPGIALMGVTEFSAALLDSFGGGAAVRSLLAVPRLAGEPALEHAGSDPAPRFRRVLELMTRRAHGFLRDLDDAGVPQGAIFAAGGFARSTALIELRASVFGEPVTVIDEPELAALGAALLASEGASGNPAVFEAASTLRVVDPLPRWSQAYSQWRQR